MFNALNRFISRLDGDGSTTLQNRSRGSHGFQVLRNTNLELHVEPWFDFVVGINGRPVDNPDPGLFAQEVRNCAGGMVSLGLWSAKGQRTRELHVRVPADTASLGLSLQWTSLAVVANVWHVLDVPANSPADESGLLPYSDYVLGSPEGALLGESGLGELVEDFIGRPMRLYVYNNEYDVTRVVSIQPSRDWGGEGALGCVLGYGALHRLPAPLSEPVSAPGETMFDGDAAAEPFTTTYGAATAGSENAPTARSGFVTVAATPPPPSSDFVVPAQMVAAGEPPLSSASRPKKKDRHAHGHGATSFMDDYFKEEEKKSMALDNAPSGRSTPLPPPPKAGPPRADAKAEPAE